ncbi:MAG: endolytic transglycosylase MltG [Sphingobacteriales bacterium]|nr:endolytic transglycosylase MltG [Sphingobacteriales bacterium]
MSKSEGKKNKGKSRFWLIPVALIFVILGWLGLRAYNAIFKSNVSTHGDKGYVYIPTGSSFDDVVSLMNSGGFIEDVASFRWVSEQMNYSNNVKPGRYRLHSGMSNRALVSKLRSGDQDPVRITIGLMRNVNELAGLVARKIEADSAAIAFLLNDRHYLEVRGYELEEAMSIFIPNTYELYWNTSAEEFLRRMLQERERFWDVERTGKAKKMGLNTREVMILASIVEQETRKNDEKPTVAGVYLNRLRKGWKLEADPTLIYAMNDFTIRRVLNEHKKVDSPYNTYMYIGLPPGPICIPSIRSIDAVLENKQHEYLFFCARADFSGYHSFAKSYTEHMQNARLFQRELDRRGIRS